MNITAITNESQFL